VESDFLSLMEYAGRILIIPTRYKRYDEFRVFRPRSDLFCQHGMNARAIVEGSPFEVGSKR